MAVVITQRLLLPRAATPAPGKKKKMPERRRKASGDIRRVSSTGDRAGLARPEIQTVQKKKVLITISSAVRGSALCSFGQASGGAALRFRAGNKRAPVLRHVKLNLTAR